MEWDEKTRSMIIEKHRHINVDHQWWDFVYEDWAGRLEGMGYDVVGSRIVDERKYDQETGKFKYTGNKITVKEYNISFSGFYSQGDGASFTGSVDILKWLKNKNDPKYTRIVKLLENNRTTELDYGAVITRHGHYYHERSTSLNLTWYPGKVYDMPNLISLLEDLEKDIDEDIVAQSIAIYRDLENEYNYLTSDEQVRDTLEINEYEFDQNGKIM
jgi:hypothetical protein